MRRKVTVVGAGNVGATCAQRIAELDHADVVLIDEEEGRAERLALDLNVAAAIATYCPTVQGTNRFEHLAGSEIVVLALDPPDDVERVAAEVRDRAPDATVIVTSNPIESVCAEAYTDRKSTRLNSSHANIS